MAPGVFKPFNKTNIKDSLALLKLKSEKHANSLKIVDLDIEARKTISENEQFIWEVKALNFNMVPVSKPSAILENYMESRSESYHQELNDMCQEMKDLCDETEDRIRQASDLLKAELNERDLEVQKLKEEISGGQFEFTSEMMIQNDLLNGTYLRTLLNKRIEAIEYFQENVIEIENDRYNRNIDILRKHGQVLMRLSPQMPTEIQELLEYEILKINQIILNNIRYYQDSKLNLLLVGENMEKDFIHYLEMCRKDYLLDKLDSVREESEQRSPFGSEFLESTEGKRAYENLKSVQDELSSIIFEHLEHTLCKGDEATKWMMQLKNAAEDLDATAKQLVNLYKDQTMSIFKGLASQLEEFKYRFLYDDPSIEGLPPSNQMCMQILKNKIYQPLEEAEKSFSDKVADLEADWVEHMTNLKETMQDTFDLLQDSSEMWDKHFQRIQDSRHMVKASLTHLEVKNSVHEQESERQLNIAIDILRQEGTETKLSRTLKNVNDLLDSMKQIYDDNYIAEAEAVAQYLDLMETESMLLVAEMKEFLEKHPNEYYNDYFDRLKSGWQTPRYDDYEVPEEKLPEEILRCKHHINALQNWKLGLREAVQYYIKICKLELRSNAHRWVERRFQGINHNRETKLILHQTRYKRVKMEVHDVRLAEIQLHQNRLAQHKSGMNMQIKEIQNQVQDFKSTTATYLNELEEFLEGIETKGKNSSSSRELKECVAQVQKKSKDIIHIVSNARKASQQDMVWKINWLTESNGEFVKALKLFSQGGNFSTDEIDIFATELGSLTKTVEGVKDSCMKSYHEEHSSMVVQIKSRAEMYVQGLNDVIEELLFAEKVAITLTKVKDFIKREAKHVKYNRKVISAKARDLLTQISLPDTEGIFTFIRKIWHPLINAIVQHRDYLLQPPAKPVEGSGDEIPAKAGLKFSGFNEFTQGDLTSKTSFGKPVEDSNYKEYQELLFNSADPPISGTSFLEVICNYMWEKFLAVQEMAKEFYTMKESKPIYKKKIIRLTYGEFVEELLVKFKYYHLQCEDVWLDEVHDFLDIVRQLQCMSNSFAVKKFAEFQVTRLQALKGAHESFLHNTKMDDKRSAKTRRELGKKLKTLHGFPGNKPLLDQLISDITESNTQILTNANEHVRQYKTYLKRRESIYRSDTQEIKELTGKLSELLAGPPNPVQDLSEQADEVLKNIRARTDSVESILSNSEVPATVKISNESQKPGDITQERTSQEQPKKIPSAYCLNLRKESEKDSQSSSQSVSLKLEQIQEKTEGSSQFVIPQGDRDSFSTLEKNINLASILPFNTDTILEISEKEFMKHITNYAEEASKYQQSVQQKSDRWIQNFEQNVKKVKELYTVRNM